MKKYLLILAILLLGLFLRAYQPLERFIYNHDSDLASWIVKDMLIDGHIRLVGQQTSEPGIFIGPLFYYLLTPFYLVNNFDPSFSVAYSWLVGLIAIFSLYYVVAKLHGRRPAIMSALIYSVSFAIVYTEREVVPTTPVTLWTIWAYYAINRRNLYLMAVLLALVWHLNLALILLLPLFFVSVLGKLTLQKLAASLAVFIFLSLPLIVFEWRHNFLQTQALVSSLVSIEDKPSPNYFHTLLYSVKNANRLFYFENHWPQFWLPISLLLAAWLLTRYQKVPKYFFTLVVSWQTLFILFFSWHPINLSEYYLNGMNIIWIIIAGLTLAVMPRIFSYLLASLFLLLNTNLLIRQNINKVGYVYKKSLVEFVKSDAKSHGFPCVSISYITNPGYELGYRYFFYLADLHVNQPSSGSPVYTIVFPHSRVNRIDRSFGALGLILPDYSKYSENQVKLSCEGLNSNLTDPMFGFTN